MSGKARVQVVLDRCSRLVDAEMRAVLHDRDDGNTVLYHIVRYHLGWADVDGSAASAGCGKRVRAAVCMLACEAVGGEAAAAAPAAAAVELLHSFTLLHDDIMDRDDTRRGRRAAWCLWGERNALLAGDGLYAIANMALVRLTESWASPANVLAAFRELNEAAVRVCEGQCADLSYEARDDITPEDYLLMAARKTGALFSAAARIGARIGGGPAQMVEALGRFGDHAGVAYQIRDDVLGIWGDQEQLGKPAGSDLRRNKRSLPIIHALAYAGPLLRARLPAARNRGPGHDVDVRELAQQVEAAGSRDFCEQVARRYVERAVGELDGVELRENPLCDLRALARHLVERTE